MSRFTESVEDSWSGITFRSAGACPGCRECRLSREATEEERQLADEGSFSWSPCESCGSHLGGDRYPAHGIGEVRRDARGRFLPCSGHLFHLEVCADCLAYLANGEEPQESEESDE